MSADTSRGAAGDARADHPAAMAGGSILLSRTPPTWVDTAVERWRELLAEAEEVYR